MVINGEITYTNQDLNRWILEAGRGDRDALRSLYRAVAPTVYAYALSILQNQYDAEDVLHDCFLTVQSSAGSYGDQGKPMAWLMVVTRNLCMRQLRDRKRSRPLEDADLFGSVQPDLMDRVVVESYMSILSEEERQIVILRVLAELRYREIAEHTGSNTSTVRTKYRRAIQKLKASLRKEGIREY